MDRFRLRFRLLYDNSVAPALGGAFAVGTNTMALIQTCQIQAIMTVPQRLCFFAELSNCNLVTCWRIELSILGRLHLSISINLSNSFSCSIRFFHWKEPWASPGRIWCPVCTFACFRGRAFLGTQYSSPYVAKLNKSVRSATRMLQRQPLYMLAHWTQHTGPSPLFDQHSFENKL